MSDQRIPICPDEIQLRLAEPPSFASTLVHPHSPGTVWEVQAPNGELLVFLIVEEFKNDGIVPFEFVRAVPLTEYVRLKGSGDTIIIMEPTKDVMLALGWLEGAVLSSSLIRCIGFVPVDCVEEVRQAASQLTEPVVSEPVVLFRESVFEQFDPVFCDAWRELYASLEKDDASVLQVVEAERIAEGVHWFADQVRLPEEAMEYLLPAFVTIEFSEERGGLEFSIRCQQKASQPQTSCHWIVSSKSKTVIKEIEPLTGPFDLSDLANEPRIISLRLADRDIRVFELQLKI